MTYTKLLSPGFAIIGYVLSVAYIGLIFSSMPYPVSSYAKHTYRSFLEQILNFFTTSSKICWASMERSSMLVHRKLYEDPLRPGHARWSNRILRQERHLAALSPNLHCAYGYAHCCIRGHRIHWPDLLAVHTS